MQLKLLIPFIIVTLIAGSAMAQISPGDLSRYHAELEGLANCTICHELRKEVSNRNCLACHRALQNRLENRSGYHASSEVSGRNCRECHSEHNGRDFEPVHWKNGIENFDHRLTGFDLQGVHADQKCRSCHKPAFVHLKSIEDSSVNLERTFLGLNTACTNCHVDEHGDQLTDNCLNCHGFAAWSPALKFSHQRSRYPLTGRHSDINCNKCHPLQLVSIASDPVLIDKRNNRGTSARYSGLQFELCTDCHSDVHHGKFGTNCAGCHTTDGFRSVPGNDFDHSRTAFALQGKHAAVACQKCHKSGRMTDPLSHEQCIDCHVDVHRGQFIQRARTGACEECHTVAGFIPSTFDLSKHDSTRYPLNGSHLAIPCIACHTEITSPDGSYSRFKFSDLTCHGCHTDAHHGQLNHWIEKNGCEYCHTTATWHRTSFDHRLARFPLEGKHREILCLECHTVVSDSTGKSTVWMKPLVMDCAGCHQDIHNGQFIRETQGETAARCERCHVPVNWRELKFEHNRDASFVLDGAHEKLACRQCHKPTRNRAGSEYIAYRPLGRTCADCHDVRKEPGTGHE